MMTAYTLVLGRQAVIIVTNCKYPTFLAFTQFFVKYLYNSVIKSLKTLF